MRSSSLETLEAATVLPTLCSCVRRRSAARRSFNASAPLLTALFFVCAAFPCHGGVAQARGGGDYGEGKGRAGGQGAGKRVESWTGVVMNPNHDDGGRGKQVDRPESSSDRDHLCDMAGLGNTYAPRQNRTREDWSSWKT